MIDPARNIKKEVSVWVTPVLLAVLAWFASDSLQSIREEIKATGKSTQAIQIDVATMKMQISNNGEQNERQLTRIAEQQRDTDRRLSGLDARVTMMEAGPSSKRLGRP